MNIIILDGSVMTSRERAYKHIARELRFPEYFGKNLDALYDLLTDLYVNEDTIVILMNCRKMKKSLGEYGDKLIEAFANASEEKGLRRGGGSRRVKGKVRRPQGSCREAEGPPQGRRVVQISELQQFFSGFT